MQPDGKLMSVAVASKLLQLVHDGATLLISEKPAHNYGLKESDDSLQLVIKQLFKGDNANNSIANKVGKGQVIIGNYNDSSFNKLGIEKDVIIKDSSNNVTGDIAWTHRKDGVTDIYFISNQSGKMKRINISLRAAGRLPALYNAVADETIAA